MAFDPNADKCLWKESIDFERTKITVSVMSYNEGVPKLQISREMKNAEGQLKFAKLGRMLKEEVEAVLPLMEKAKEHL